jgi:hypothetical protein
MGEYDAETATFSNFAGGGGASPYTPSEDAHLVALRVMPAATAATSLLEGVLIRLTCNSFKPNMLEVGCKGNGLRTAPAAAQDLVDWVVDQEVKAGVPVTMEGRNVAGTPVGVQAFLWGLFES